MKTINVLFLKGEDFHLFSCGSFIKNKRIPDEQTKHDVFDILRNNLAYSVAGKHILNRKKHF
jgi:hypothetical protein